VRFRVAERVFWLFRCSEDLCSALILSNRHCNRLLKSSIVVPRLRRPGMGALDSGSALPCPAVRRGGAGRKPAARGDAAPC